MFSRRKEAKSYFHVHLSHRKQASWRLKVSFVNFPLFNMMMMVNWEQRSASFMWHYFIFVHFRRLLASSHLTTCLTFNIFQGKLTSSTKTSFIPSNDKSPRRWVNFNSGLWYCEFCSNRILQYFPLSVRTTLTTWTTWTNGPRGQFGHPAPPRPLWPIKPLWQSWLIND